MAYLLVEMDLDFQSNPEMLGESVKVTDAIFQKLYGNMRTA